MRLELTYRQLGAVRYWATPRHLEYINQSKPVRSKHSVSMPPIAWKVLLGRMTEEAFTTWGKRRRSKMRGELGGTFSAIEAVAKGLAELEAHPALAGVIVIGTSAQAFSVWPFGDQWSVYPKTGSSMLWLVPEYISDQSLEANGVTWTPPEGITRWRPSIWSDLIERGYPGIFEEAEHLGWRQAASGSDVDTRPRLAE